MPANHENVFEASGSNQGGARAASLQQSVGAHRRAVDYFQRTQSRARFSGNPLQTAQDCQRWIERRGRDLEDLGLSFNSNNEVGESAAGINSDAQASVSLSSGFRQRSRRLAADKRGFPRIERKYYDSAKLALSLLSAFNPRSSAAYYLSLTNFRPTTGFMRPSRGVQH